MNDEYFEGMFSMAKAFTSESHQIADVMTAKGKSAYTGRPPHAKKLLALRRRQRAIQQGGRSARAAATAMEASFWLTSVTTKGKRDKSANMLLQGANFASEYAAVAILCGAKYSTMDDTD